MCKNNTFSKKNNRAVPKIILNRLYDRHRSEGGLVRRGRCYSVHSNSRKKVSVRSLIAGLLSKPRRYLLASLVDEIVVVGQCIEKVSKVGDAFCRYFLQQGHENGRGRDIPHDFSFIYHLKCYFTLQTHPTLQSDCNQHMNFPPSHGTTLQLSHSLTLMSVVVVRQAFL